MKLLLRYLSILFIVCLAPVAVLSEAAGGYSLINPIEESSEPYVTIRFAGERGQGYTLHCKYRSVWLQPMTTTLAVDQTEGSFEVKLGDGVNDFLLAESGQPRDAKNAIPFSIRYAASGPSSAPKADETPQDPAETNPPAETTAPEPMPEPTPLPEEGTDPELPEPSPVPTPAPTLTPSPMPATQPDNEDSAAPERVISLWMTGNDVEALQEGLSALNFRFGRVDGVYGPRTRAAVMRFQRKHFLKVDGLVGVATRAMFAELGIGIPLYAPPDLTMPEGFSRTLSYGMQGLDVFTLQQALIDEGYLQRSPDQAFGRHTRAAVRAFQEANGLRLNGVAGPETLRLLIGMPAVEDAESADEGREYTVPNPEDAHETVPAGADESADPPEVAPEADG